MTFNDLCHVCDLDYDYIAKVETMSMDTQWLLPTLLQQDADLSMSWKHWTDNGRLTLQPLPTANRGHVMIVFVLIDVLCRISNFLVVV